MESTEKLARIRPQLVEQIEALMVGSQHGALLAPVLVLLRPKLEAQVDGFLARPAADIDAALGRIAAALLALRSDDAPAVDADDVRAAIAGYLEPTAEG